MNGFAHLVASAPAAKALGWTLFHSLWEGALAALVVAGMLLAARSPRMRYACACLALAGVFGGFALTFGLLLAESSGAAGAAPGIVLERRAAAGQFAFEAPARLRFEDMLPWLAPVWAAGVIAFHLRALAAWMAARRLRERGVCAARDPWPQRLRELGERLRVRRPVALLETALAEVPVVAGYLRPAILVPVGMLAAMPPAQVEAILLHELAHIRRRDYLVNLLQTAVEGFLFYHPAVWWISGVIRAEREHCCDDIAVAESGDVREYAAALTNLERTRRAPEMAALASTGGNLMMRIRRLLDPPPRAAMAPLWSAAVLLLTAAGALAAWQAAAPAQNRSAEEKVSPYRKWLEQDVVYIIEKRERAAFERLRTDEEREHFIEQFWLRRDPTPGTPQNEFKEEHYRRIAYANTRFASSLPGWKTDRGRIYILLGPPDEIETHPNGRPGREYPIEDWLYHQVSTEANKQTFGPGGKYGLVIEFADAGKTGEFKQVANPPGAPTGL